MNKHKITLFTVLFFQLLNYGSFYFAQNLNSARVSEQYGTGSNIFLNFYQNVISPVRGGISCPMYPSCSQYSKIAFNELPFHLAFMKTFDRVMRCGHELQSYPFINTEGFMRWYDPVVEDEEQSRFISGPSAKFTPDSSSGNFTGLDSRFADFLFEHNDFQRATTEYLRLRFYETDSVKRTLYLFKSGLSQFKSGSFDDFISFAGENRHEFIQYPELKAELEFYLAKSHFELKSYNRAITAFDEAEMNNSSGLNDEINFYRGVSYARLFFWGEALKNMKKVSTSSPRTIIARRFENSLNEAETLPRLSSFFAGLASAVIPGSGYLYAHRTGTAITSFVINSLFAWTAYAAIKKSNYSLAALTITLGSGWYLGNIYGSSEAANEYNSRLRNELIDKTLNMESN